MLSWHSTSIKHYYIPGNNMDHVYRVPNSRHQWVESWSAWSVNQHSHRFRRSHGNSYSTGTNLQIAYCCFFARQFAAYSDELHQFVYLPYQILKNIPASDSSCASRLLNYRYAILHSGFMLSVLCNRTQVTVGSSTAIFGVLGGLIAYLIINWIALEKYGNVRSTLCCIIGILVVFSLLFSIGSSIDAIAHIGGLIGGILISLAILPAMEEKSRILTMIGLGGIVGMNLITFLVFFLTNWLLIVIY